MLFKTCSELESKSESFVLITMTKVRGSAPQDLGAKCIVTEQGLYQGTVGGGKVEAAAIKYAQSMLEEKNTALSNVTWNLQKDIGMTCGGEVSFLFEPFISNQWPIAIFGAGHVCQALTRLLETLNCSVTCIDNRKQWLEKLNKKTNTIHAENMSEVVKQLDPKSFIISMTQGHASDVPILFEVFKTLPDCPFIGVIGSKVKGIRIKDELKQMGVSDDFLNKLLVPIGLDIGSNAPAEIAVSITAQLLQKRDKKDKL